MFELNRRCSQDEVDVLKTRGYEFFPPQQDEDGNTFYVMSGCWTYYDDPSLAPGELGKFPVND